MNARGKSGGPVEWKQTMFPDGVLKSPVVIAAVPPEPVAAGVTFHAVAVKRVPFQCQMRDFHADGEQCGSSGRGAPTLSRMSEPTAERKAPLSRFITSCHVPAAKRNTAHPMLPPQPAGTAIDATMPWLSGPRKGPHSTSEIGVFPRTGSIPTRSRVATWAAVDFEHFPDWPAGSAKADALVSRPQATAAVVMARTRVAVIRTAVDPQP